MDPKLALAGLLIGVLVGATGMGGGSLLTPLLVLLFGFNPTVAVGTDLFHGAIFKSIGAVRHRRLGTVQARLSAWMLVGSAPTSLAGVWVATWLRHRYGGGAPHIQEAVIAAALVAGGLGTMLKSVVRVRERPDGPFVMGRRDRVAAVAIGLFGGFIVGMTSVGSGVFFALTLLIVFPLRSSKVVGTDILHGAALLWIAGAAHLAAGNVSLHAVGFLLIGSIPGVLLGSSFGVRLPERWLRLCMGIVLLISGAKLLPIHESNTAAGAALVAGLAFALYVSLRRNSRVIRGPAARNLRWQRHDIDKGSHAALLDQRPGVLWLTGLSGAGKSTIANEVERRLHTLGKHTYILDGDNIRHGLNSDLGFTAADRTENIRRVAEVAKLMVDAGLIVIVAFISPFRADRELARERFAVGEFLEVFVDTPLDVAEARDPKGLYEKARAGAIPNFTGVDSPYEPPEAPEVRLDTTCLTVGEAADAVLDVLETRGFIRGRLAPVGVEAVATP